MAFLTGRQVVRLPSILFVHDDYPAQFGAFGHWLAGRGWDVTFATAAPNARTDGPRLLRYAPHRAPSPETHPYAQPMDRAALRAQAFVRAALAARGAGYRPDIAEKYVCAWDPIPGGVPPLID